MGNDNYGRSQYDAPSGLFIKMRDSAGIQWESAFDQNAELVALQDHYLENGGASQEQLSVLESLISHASEVCVLPVPNGRDKYPPTSRKALSCFLEPFMKADGLLDTFSVYENVHAEMELISPITVRVCKAAQGSHAISTCLSPDLTFPQVVETIAQRNRWDPGEEFEIRATQELTGVQTSVLWISFAMGDIDSIIEGPCHDTLRDKARSAGTSRRIFLPQRQTVVFPGTEEELALFEAGQSVATALPDRGDPVLRLLSWSTESEND